MTGPQVVAQGPLGELRVARRCLRATFAALPCPVPVSILWWNMAFKKIQTRNTVIP